MRRFEDFAHHELDVISDMANMLIEYQQVLNAGDITYDEFSELSSDILDYGKINEYAESVDQKAFMKEAIDALIFIVDHIPLG
jgi:hypothetical protein